MSDILCITNRRLTDGNFLRKVEEIAAARPKGIVLREKDLTEKEYYILAKEVIKICRKYETDCILHSFTGAAQALRVNSIQLPLDIMRNLSAKQKACFKYIGVSCHLPAEAKEAEELGASCIMAGHIYDTDCKKGINGRGEEFLSDICKSVTVPVYAIGGITPENIGNVRKAGAFGAGIMSGIMKCENTAKYLASFERIKRDKLLLYGITGCSAAGSETLFEQAEKALKGGVTILQLREKNLSEAEFTEKAVKMKKLCDAYNVPLIINDNLSVALKADADGIHVGKDDMSADEIRKIAPKNFIIGVTAKTVKQAKNAEYAGADYLGVGAIFPSQTKPSAIRITPKMLKEIANSVSVPIVAIGGITERNIHELKECDINGIAAVSSIFASDDIENAAAKLKEKVTDYVR